MHPNAFLRSYWRTELRDTIFVAMGFAEHLRTRFDCVFRPAIEGISIDGRSLSATRVDESRTGDSILTDIMESIAHARLVLADVSTVCIDPATSRPMRNGNVMYEVGIALASRMPSEVLIVRNDNDPLLFDTTVIPHVQIDFSNEVNAQAQLRATLVERMKEVAYVNDARVQIAIKNLTGQEIKVLRDMAKIGDNQLWAAPSINSIDPVGGVAFPRLLDKGLIVLVSVTDKGRAAYRLSPLGRVVAGIACDLPVIMGDR